MANPEVKLALGQRDYSLTDLFDILRTDIFLSLFCHHVGEIQSFDPDNQTVTATIKYKRTYFEQQPNGVDPVPVLKDYPLLVDIPVIVIGGGGFNVTFPIKKGDECVLLFNDRSIDNWFQSGQVGGVSSPRAHSLSDGIALVGLQNLTRLIANYDPARASLRDTTGLVRMGVGESKLHFQNSSISLLATLTQLRTTLTTLTNALKTFATATQAAAVEPTLGPASATLNAATTGVLTSLTTTQTNLDNLLETIT